MKNKAPILSPDPDFLARWGAWILVAVTVLAYLPATGCGFIWDDDSYITKNAALRSLRGLADIWFRPGATPQYYPLTFTTLWVEHQIWGLGPAGYHLVNILFHALNAILLWRVLRRLNVPGAIGAAALFALSPVMVESVVWVTERKNVLSTLFYLLSLQAYLRFRPLNGDPEPPGGMGRFYLPAFGFFAAALLSKTVACSLPAVLVLLIWWKRGRLERRDALALAPWFLLGLGLGLTTAWLEKHHVGASGAEWEMSWLGRILLAGRALVFYAGKLVWPRDLVFIYPRWTIDPDAAVQYLYPLAAVSVVAALWLLRGRIGRGPLTAVLCFAGTLVPALGFINVYPFRFSYVADHFQYLASLSLFALAGALGAEGLRRAGLRFRVPGRILMTVLLAACGTATWSQIRIYKNLETLWRDTLTRNPGAWIAFNNLGTLLDEQGRTAETIPYFREAVRLKPDYHEALSNLGANLTKLKQTEEAIPLLLEAIRLNPKFAEAFNHLGNAYVLQGRSAEAEAKYREVLRLKPDHARAHFNLAVLLDRAGQTAEAITHFRQGLEYLPGDAKAHQRLGMLLARQGRSAEAAPHLQASLQVLPDDVETLNALAWIQATDPDSSVRNGAEAVVLAERVRSLAGNRSPPSLLDTLAAAYAEAGRFDEAVRIAAEAEQGARSRGDRRTAEEIGARRALYLRRQPYRSPVAGMPDGPD